MSTPFLFDGDQFQSTCKYRNHFKFPDNLAPPILSVGVYRSDLSNWYQDSGLFESRLQRFQLRFLAAGNLMWWNFRLRHGTIGYPMTILCSMDLRGMYLTEWLGQYGGQDTTNLWHHVGYYVLQAVRQRYNSSFLRFAWLFNPIVGSDVWSCHIHPKKAGRCWTYSNSKTTKTYKNHCCLPWQAQYKKA